MIAVVDYHKGNLKSVERGLRAVGGEALITDSPQEIATADAIVLPGVGSFADATQTMQKLGQSEVIRERVEAGIPFLGICLGMHLMFEGGTEGAVDGEVDHGLPSDINSPSGLDLLPGLGLLPGIVTKMPTLNAQGERFKIPHVGWNTIDFDERRAGALLQGIDEGAYLYFTHSYIVPPTGDALATTSHSVEFPSMLSFGEKAFGVQFHPEKSSEVGAKILSNFLRIMRA